MKYRVTGIVRMHEGKELEIFPTYFRTKREAVAYMNEHGGHIERKIGCEWCKYNK